MIDLYSSIILLICILSSSLVIGTRRFGKALSAYVLLIIALTMLILHVDDILFASLFFIVNSTVIIAIFVFYFMSKQGIKRIRRIRLKDSIILLPVALFLPLFSFSKSKEIIYNFDNLIFISELYGKYTYLILILGMTALITIIGIVIISFDKNRSIKNLEEKDDRDDFIHIVDYSHKYEYIDEEEDK
jgi:signal transduction histidine kinase